jgi:L-fuconolactonase
MNPTVYPARALQARFGADYPAYPIKVTRRDLIGLAASTALAASRGPAILDTHIHLFDPTRRQGVPWPAKDDPVLYKPALPARYRQIAEPLGVRGAIEVEASPWLEDNQWVLDVAAQNPIIVGMVGNLEPAHAQFPAQFERFRRNPLFLGIRYGNLWGRDLSAQLANPAFLAGMKTLAGAGLVMDAANPNSALLDAVLHLTDRVPGLRVVLDHLPRLEESYNFKDLTARPQVYAKVSGVPRCADGKVREDTGFYRDRLDRLWEAFGAGRLLYGSDWPNSDNWAPYGVGLRIVREYFGEKGAEAAAKFFWTNSQTAYRWRPR